MKLCIVNASIITSICATAETRTRTYSQGGQFIETSSTIEGRHIETRIWESESDYYKYQQHKQPKAGWVYGVGKATGNLAHESDYIIRKALDDAYDRLILQLLGPPLPTREVVREPDGLSAGERAWNEWADKMKPKIIANVQKFGLQYRYRIDNPDDTVTYVFCVGFDKAKADLIEKGLIDEDTKAVGKKN